MKQPVAYSTVRARRQQVLECTIASQNSSFLGMGLESSLTNQEQRAISRLQLSKCYTEPSVDCMTNSDHVSIVNLYPHEATAAGNIIN